MVGTRGAGLGRQTQSPIGRQAQSPIGSPSASQDSRNDGHTATFRSLDDIFGEHIAKVSTYVKSMRKDPFFETFTHWTGAGKNKQILQSEWITYKSVVRSEIKTVHPLLRNVIQKGTTSSLNRDTLTALPELAREFLYELVRRTTAGTAQSIVILHKKTEDGAKVLIALEDKYLGVTRISRYELKQQIASFTIDVKKDPVIELEGFLRLVGVREQQFGGDIDKEDVISDILGILSRSGGFYDGFTENESLKKDTDYEDETVEDFIERIRIWWEQKIANKRTNDTAGGVADDITDTDDRDTLAALLGQALQKHRANRTRGGFPPPRKFINHQPRTNPTPTGNLQTFDGQQFQCAVCGDGTRSHVAGKMHPAWQCPLLKDPDVARVIQAKGGSGSTSKADAAGRWPKSGKLGDVAGGLENDEKTAEYSDDESYDDEAAALAEVFSQYIGAADDDCTESFESIIGGVDDESDLPGWQDTAWYDNADVLGGLISSADICPQCDDSGCEEVCSCTYCDKENISPDMVMYNKKRGENSNVSGTSTDNPSFLSPLSTVTTSYTQLEAVAESFDILPGQEEPVIDTSCVSDKEVEKTAPANDIQPPADMAVPVTLCDSQVSLETVSHQAETGSSPAFGIPLPEDTNYAGSFSMTPPNSNAGSVSYDSDMYVSSCASYVSEPLEFESVVDTLSPKAKLMEEEELQNSINLSLYGSPFAPLSKDEEILDDYFDEAFSESSFSDTENDTETVSLPDLYYESDTESEVSPDIYDNFVCDEVAPETPKEELSRIGYCLSVFSALFSGFNLRIFLQLLLIICVAGTCHLCVIGMANRNDGRESENVLAFYKHGTGIAVSQLGFAVSLWFNFSVRWKAPLEIIDYTRESDYFSKGDILAPLMDTAAAAKQDKTAFLVDTGASQFITSERTFFTFYDKSAPTRTFKVAAPTALTSKAVGTIAIPWFNKTRNRMETQVFHNVYYCPDQPLNLISVRKLFEHGFTSPDFERCEIARRSDSNVFPFTDTGHSYLLGCNNPETAGAVDTDRVVRDTANWQFNRKLYINLKSEVLASDEPWLELFSDGNGMEKGKQNEPEACSIQHRNAYSIGNWNGGNFYANCVY